MKTNHFNPLSTLSIKEYNDLHSSVARHLKGISHADALDFASFGIEHICEQADEGRFDNLNPNADYKGYCFVVAYRKALGELEKSKTKKKLLQIDQRDISDIYDCADVVEDDYYDFSEEKEQIGEIVASQKGKEAEVLKLSLSNYPDPEIADELDITLSNVRKSRHTSTIRVAKEMYARGYRSKFGKLGLIGKYSDDAA